MKKRIERLIAQFRKDRETLRGLQGKKKLQFVWDYYKIPSIVIAFSAVVAVLAVFVRSPTKDTAVYIVWVNAVSQDENSYFDDLLHAADPEFSEKFTDLNTGYSLGIEGNEASDAQTLQVLAALFGVGDLDIYIADKTYFDQYERKDAFADLSELLPEEILSQAGNRICYHVTGKGVRIPDAYVITEGSGADIAGYLRPGEKAYLGILDNAQNKENAAKLLAEMIRSDPEQAGQNPKDTD